MKLPANQNYRIIAYGDAHAPHHLDAAINMTIKLAKAFAPNVAVAMGDQIDFLSLGRWLKSPREEAGLQQEITTFQEMQARINRAMPKDCQHFYLIGNHCARLESLIKSKAPALLDLPSLNIENVLGLKKLGMRVVPTQLQIGSVAFTHGHLIRKHSGATPMAHLEEIGFTNSVIHGHSHRQAIVSKQTANGPVFGIETGSLCDPSLMDYIKSTVTNWQLGICLIEFKKGAPPSFELVPYHGKRKLTAVWRGRIFRA